MLGFSPQVREVLCPRFGRHWKEGTAGGIIQELSFPNQTFLGRFNLPKWGWWSRSVA